MIIIAIVFGVDVVLTAGFLNYRPHIPTPRIPPPIAALISACWAPDPRNRPDAAQVVETLQDHMLAVGVEEQARTSKGTSYQTSSGCGCVIS